MRLGEAWFCDLEVALKVFHEKVPDAELFSSIEPNIYGDICIMSGGVKYIVTHKTFHLWRFNAKEDKWKAVE